VHIIVPGKAQEQKMPPRSTKFREVNRSDRNGFGYIDSWMLNKGV